MLSPDYLVIINEVENKQFNLSVYGQVYYDVSFWFTERFTMKSSWTIFKPRFPPEWDRIELPEKDHHLLWRRIRLCRFSQDGKSIHDQTGSFEDTQQIRKAGLPERSALIVQSKALRYRQEQHPLRVELWQAQIDHHKNAGSQHMSRIRFIWRYSQTASLFLDLFQHLVEQ